jgi:hypothetical protein
VTIMGTAELSGIPDILCLQQDPDCLTLNPGRHWCGRHARIPIRIFLPNSWITSMSLHCERWKCRERERV